jgi:hypothetical protein
MKKLFPLSVPEHQAPRVVEQIKAEVRKYLKRERKKSLPEGVDFWDFDCRIGQSADVSEKKHVEEIISAIDQNSANGAVNVYIEILAKPAYRLGGKTKAENLSMEASHTNEPLEDH